MATTTSRSARYAKWLSIPLGLVISALLIWQASYAAFTDSVTSPGNSWTAGSVTFAEDDEIKVLFNEKDLVRKDSGTASVTLTYTGTLAADVEFYGDNYTTTNDLGSHINLLVEGTEGANSGVVFDNTLEEFSKTRFSFPTPGGERTGTFKFTYTLNEDAPQSVQNGTASIDFVIKAQSRTS